MFEEQDIDRRRRAGSRARRRDGAGYRRSSDRVRSFSSRVSRLDRQPLIVDDRSAHVHHQAPPEGGLCRKVAATGCGGKVERYRYRYIQLSRTSAGTSSVTALRPGALQRIVGARRTSMARRHSRRARPWPAGRRRHRTPARAVFNRACLRRGRRPRLAKSPDGSALPARRHRVLDAVFHHRLHRQPQGTAAERSCRPSSIS